MFSSTNMTLKEQGDKALVSGKKGVDFEKKWQNKTKFYNSGILKNNSKI